jgi:hypothetical protein
MLNDEILIKYQLKRTKKPKSIDLTRQICNPIHETEIIS